MSRQAEIARCVEEQRRCREHVDATGLDPDGNWMGLTDWLMEEAILRSKVQPKCSRVPAAIDISRAESIGWGGASLRGGLLHTQEVRGSSPCAPTTPTPQTVENKAMPEHTTPIQSDLTACLNGEDNTKVQPKCSQDRARRTAGWTYLPGDWQLWDLAGEAALVPLSPGRGHTLVDPDVAEALRGHRVYGLVCNGGAVYARAFRNVYLHRWITRAPRHLVVDHINGDTLDNRRRNLRLCTLAENARNRSKSPNHVSPLSRYVGVSCCRKLTDRTPWRAQINVGGKRVNLGDFQTQEEAARAYDQAARESFGEFAYQNFGGHDAA